MDAHCLAARPQRKLDSRASLTTAELIARQEEIDALKARVEEGDRARHRAEEKLEQMAKALTELKAAVTARQDQEPSRKASDAPSRKTVSVFPVPKHPRQSTKHHKKAARAANGSPHEIYARPRSEVTTTVLEHKHITRSVDQVTVPRKVY